ncbi:MAG: hypothetical protein LBG80_02950 [Bacteroidales bacterium]|jgi:hypothetical protein|nr:hypothetical protein [Bacteroidales bacterium]
MPYREIRELRESGRLEEALAMALTELNNSPENIWAKRNISWVYYAFAKQNILPENFTIFSLNINKIINLSLSEEEKMLYESIVWQIIKMGYAILRLKNIDEEKLDTLFSFAKELHLTKPSKVYSALFNLFYKSYKDNALKYLELADWWGFDNFMQEDYAKVISQNGQELISLVERAYISYAKNLLPCQLSTGEIYFNREKAESFLPKLSLIEEQHPEYLYLSYYKAKLLLALGDRNNMLSALLPFAKRKSNDFWVWEVLAAAFPNDEKKVFACYCRGLSCFAPEEMLVKLRAKIVPYFLKKEMWDEAKTEIAKIIEIRNKKNWAIPPKINDWTLQDWYSSASENDNNRSIYKQYSPVADEILFNDIPEESIIVEFVNSNKKIIIFISSEQKTGYFKYDRFLKSVQIGDTLKVRFLKKDINGSYSIATIKPFDIPELKQRFIKEFDERIKIHKNNTFGFIDDIFVSSEFISKYKLTDGIPIVGKAIKSFNKKKNEWGWKIINIKLPH